ncbi:MAG: hypothetical protein IM577_06925, partial [Chitinophagaceae bacterium]|nr:hypothetical protein [Chitinophagaceae bacterium]
VDSNQCNACYIGANPLPPVSQPTVPIGGGTLPKPDEYSVDFTIYDTCKNSIRCDRDLDIFVQRKDATPLNCDVAVKINVYESANASNLPDRHFPIVVKAGLTYGNLTLRSADAWGSIRVEIAGLNTSHCSSQSVIQLPSPSGNCTSDSLYRNKIRRIIPYANGDGIAFSGTSNVSSPDLQQELAELVQSRADAILDELSTTATCAITPSALNNLRSSLVPLLTETVTINNPFGNSTNGSLSFQDIFTQQIGAITGVDCSPYLVSMFYPLNYQPSLQTREIIQTDNTICTRINALIQASGIPATDYLGLHNYFKAKFTSSYTLTDQQLTDLIQSCNSCSPARYLEKPMKLPIFFESDRVTLSKSAFQQLVNEFHALHQITSGNLSVESQKDNYALAFTNYINYKTGFSLGYSDYVAFANDPLAQELINRYVTPETDELLSSCVADLFLNATASAAFTHKRYIDSIRLAFRNTYLSTCTLLNPVVQLASILYEYHYTLYYYDQSGNLVKTVPPQGVSVTGTPVNYPQHSLVTTYEYNSFNQVTRQTTPDAGTSQFWYDVLGRLVASQNAEQKSPLNGGSSGRYSYTFYDALGRIIEVGETVNQAGFELPEITDAIAKNPIQLKDWQTRGLKTQITQTFYDAPALGIVPHTDILVLQGWANNRKRVVSTITRNSFADARYQTGTHYLYDISGNVRTLWQEVESLRELQAVTGEKDGNGIKRIDYDYDLVSGKVNQVTYQKNKSDQFLYRYQYDAENRLTQATTSTDGLTWKTQAAYQYYLHGPLSRVELGEQIQATDYAYTLQGWMKYINGPILHPEADMGNDGTDKHLTNFYFGRDVMAFGIQYYSGDYSPILNTPGNRFTNNFQLNNLPTGQPLYNGNISATLLGLKGLNNNTTTGYTYQYDQLNRLLNTRQHSFGVASGGFRGSWTQTNAGVTDNYAETFRYDANGNILQLNRNGHSQQAGGVAMDRLTYTYRSGTNQLWSVQDAVASNAYTGDIDNQGGSNYSYDRIGNLIGDVSESIQQVNWTVYGKIGNIRKKQAFLGYVYNAGGERVVKQYLPYATNQCGECPPGTGIDDLEVYERNSNNPETYRARKTITFLSEYTDERYREYSAIIEAGLAQCTPQCNVQPPLNTSDADIYIRDATGNVLAVYHYDRKTAQLRWSEQHLYGSSRLGMYQPEKVVASVSTDSKQREVGYWGKQIFELSNHLGNVLATITDKKLQVSTNNNSTSYFEAEVQSVQDYYAFGMQMPGRKLSGGYRYGFNGKENDNEVKGEGNQIDFGARIYDQRLGRWLSLDPLFTKYPNWSAYNFTMDNPILFIDPDGKVVIVKDITSYKAILGTLTANEISRIKINKNGTIAISGKDPGSKNLQNLRILVESKINHNIITSNSYKSAGGEMALPDNVYGRTLFPESENDIGLPNTHTSPDNDVYVILKPNTEEGIVAVLAHESFGHAVLGEKKRKGEKVSPYHDFGPEGEKNNDFKKQGWKAVGEAKENYKNNFKNKEWKKTLDKKVREFEAVKKKK